MKTRLFKLTAVIFILFAVANLFSQETDGFIQRGRTLNSIGFGNSGSGVIAANSGGLYYTTNSGETWLMTNSGTNDNLNKISITTGNIVLAAGNNGTLIRSMDMGITWQEVQLNKANAETSPGDFLSVTLLPSGRGFVCGLNGAFKMTTDFGLSWTDRDARKNVDLLSVSMYDDGKGILTGSNSTLLYTTNGGDNWNVPGSSLSVQVNYNYAVMTSASTAYSVTSKGHIVKTTDSGNTWLIVYEDPLQVPLTKIEMIPGGNGITAIGNNGTILISNDEGATWQRELSGITDDLNCICFSNSRIGFTGGKNGLLLKTIDGGLKWSKVDYLPYARKGNGEIKTLPKSSFALNQNYPNPFNPSTAISFTIPDDATVSLKIFDIAGREIAAKEFGAMGAGTHTYNYNASGLSSGVYFYRITAKAKLRVYSETMRMILTK